MKINFHEPWKENMYKMYSFKGYTPLLNGKLYLGYGLQYAPVELRYYSYKVIRIPLAVRYRYPGRIIRPQAALGLNVYHINDGKTSEFVRDFVPSYLVGMVVKVYQNVSLSFNLEGDMLWNAYINASETPSFSRSNNIGVMISL